jgi:KipI family sensor histidine kinase inhibitor
MPNQPKFLHAGDTALVIEFGSSVDRHVSGLVLALAQRIAAAGLAGVVETVPTFRSLMVHYDPLRVAHADLVHALTPMLDALEPSERAGRRWRVPTCYHESLGLDVAEVAARTRLSVEQVVEKHSATTFHIYMMGFLPGFPYLGDLPAELQLPRRDSPRIKVPSGSIAIAMRQTAIYTLESPGGWHILGRTPAPLWDLRQAEPAVLAAGDKVEFAPIALADYEALLARAGAGEWRMQPEAAAGARP